MTHTLATGAPPIHQFAGLPGKRGRTLMRPEKTLTLVVGPPGSGKTWFLSSIPGMYLLNLDRSSITAPNPKAVVWPEDPSEVMDFDGLRKVHGALIALAVAGKPRPEVVGIDSYTAMLNLLEPWIVKNAVPLCLSKTPVTAWNELNGKAAYDLLYKMSIGFFKSLQDVGYGVWLSAHLVNEVIQIGENQNVIQPGFTFTSKLWRRFNYMTENVLPFVPRWSTIEKENFRMIPVRGAPPKRERYLTTENVQQFQIVTDDPKLSGITKCRVPLPTITLPENDPWAAFQEAYTAAGQSLADGPTLDTPPASLKGTDE